MVTSSESTQCRHRHPLLATSEERRKNARIRKILLDRMNRNDAVKITTYRTVYSIVLGFERSSYILLWDLISRCTHDSTSIKPS